MAKVEPTLPSVQALIASGQTAEARAQLDRMLKREPHVVQLRLLAAQLALSANDHECAARHASTLLTTNDGDAGALRVLAQVAQASGDHPRAVEFYRRITASNPSDLGAAHALSDALLRADDLLSAERLLREAVEAHPMSERAWNALATLLLATGRASEAAQVLEDASIRLPRDQSIASFLASTLNYVGGVSPARVHRAHERAARLFEPAVPPPQTYENLPDPERTLRVGYISPDLRKHSVSYFLEPLLKAHDRARTEIYIYMTGKKSDEVTERLRQLGTWVECAALSDRALNQRIRQDRIDILVELSGHTTGHSLSAIGQRPAPVILSAIGYPHSTGLRAIQARIADAITDPLPTGPPSSDARTSHALRPPGSTNHATPGHPNLDPPNHDSTNLNPELPGDVLRLDRCFLCYGPPDAPAPAAIDPSRPPTFGSFNSFQKIGPEAIATWSRILHAVPGSRLLLKGDARLSGVTSRLREGFVSTGIEPERVETLNNTATPEQARELYGLVDVALDTFPYNGTTTTCESLWMGVPVVALLGETHASRVSASLLTAIGTPELIATSPDSYVEIAARLITDRPRVIDYRKRLRALVTSSPLCDASGYAHAIEGAYRTVWRAWCASRPSEGAG